MNNWLKKRGYLSILMLIALGYYLLLHGRIAGIYSILNIQEIALWIVIFIIPLGLISRIFILDARIALKLSFVVVAIVMNVFIVLCFGLVYLNEVPLSYKIIDFTTILVLFALMAHATALEDKATKLELGQNIDKNNYLAFGARYALLFLIPTTIGLFMFYMIMIIAFRNGGPA